MADDALPADAQTLSSAELEVAADLVLHELALSLGDEALVERILIEGLRDAAGKANDDEACIESRYRRESMNDGSAECDRMPGHIECRAGERDELTDLLGWNPDPKHACAVPSRFASGGTRTCN